MGLKKIRLILIFGLPGTGKSTLATAVAERLNICHLNTDIVRDQQGKRGQYSEEDKARIYTSLLKLAGDELLAGHSVIVDGTFYKKTLRTPFAELAGKTGVTLKWIQVHASGEVVKERVSKKRKYSEADYRVYEKIASEFEPLQDSCLNVFSDREGLDEMIYKSLSYISQ